MILGWQEQMVWGTISEHVVLEMKKNNKKNKKIKNYGDFVLCGVNNRLVTGV